MSDAAAGSLSHQQGNVQSEVERGSVTTEPPKSRRAEFWAGVRTTVPLAVGAIPFAIIFGATAMSVGLSTAGALGMSAFVFAGSAQFIAVELLGNGASIAVVVFTTLIVNVRHALYAVSLAPHMRHLSQRWLTPLSFWLTDETYVTVIRRYAQPDASPYKMWFHLGSATFLYTTWLLSTALGVWTGRSIADPGRWGLDFALAATFIGMLVPMLKERPALLATLAAGACSLLFHGLPNGMGLLLAALTGVAAGLLAEQMGAARPRLGSENA